MGRPCSYPGEGSRTWLIVVFTGHIIICEESEKNCNVTIGQVAYNSRLGNQQEIFAQILFNIISIMKHLFVKNSDVHFLQIRQIFYSQAIPTLKISMNGKLHCVLLIRCWERSIGSSGCKLSPHERRNGVQWFPPTGDRFETASIYNGIC